MLVLEKFRASITLYKKYAQNQTLDRIRRRKSTIRIKVAKYGLVAQLRERSVRIREVEGSNPFESTKQKCRCRGFSAHGIYTFGDLADKVVDQSEIRTHSSAGRSPPDF